MTTRKIISAVLSMALGITSVFSVPLNVSAVSTDVSAVTVNAETTTADISENTVTTATVTSQATTTTAYIRSTPYPSAYIETTQTIAQGESVTLDYSTAI